MWSVILIFFINNEEVQCITKKNGGDVSEDVADSEKVWYDEDVVKPETPNSDEVEVAAIDPVASMQAVENPALAEIASEVRDKLKNVINNL